MTQADRQQYAREVWSAFKDHARPSSRLTLDMASPAEWWLISQWMADEIPLRVVLRGFEDCKGQGKTLLYYAGAVNGAWRHWLEAVS